MKKSLRANSSSVLAAPRRGFKQSVNLAWPLVVALSVPVLLIAIEVTPIDLDFVYTIFVEPALLIAWGCIGIGAAIIAVREIRHQHWKAAAASMILPSGILFAGLQFSRFIHFCNYAGDILYFLARRSSYVQVIAEHTPGEPRLVVFNRGGMSWSSRGFVYDESDEILQKPAMQSVGWKERANRSELSCGYIAQPLMRYLAIAKHWYIASFPC